MKKKKIKDNQKNYKVVCSAAIARRLLHRGYKIVDIKPNKENSASTNFVFLIEGNFMDDFNILIKNI